VSSPNFWKKRFSSPAEGARCLKSTKCTLTRRSLKKRSAFLTLASFWTPKTWTSMRARYQPAAVARRPHRDPDGSRFGHGRPTRTVSRPRTRAARRPCRARPPRPGPARACRTVAGGAAPRHLLVELPGLGGNRLRSPGDGVDARAGGTPCVRPASALPHGRHRPHLL